MFHIGSKLKICFPILLWGIIYFSADQVVYTPNESKECEDLINAWFELQGARNSNIFSFVMETLFDAVWLHSNTMRIVHFFERENDSITKCAPYFWTKPFTSWDSIFSYGLFTMEGYNWCLFYILAMIVNSVTVFFKFSIMYTVALFSPLIIIFVCCLLMASFCLGQDPFFAPAFIILFFAFPSQENIFEEMTKKFVRLSETQIHEAIAFHFTDDLAANEIIPYIVPLDLEPQLNSRFWKVPFEYFFTFSCIYFKNLRKFLNLFTFIFVLPLVMAIFYAPEHFVIYLRTIMNVIVLPSITIPALWFILFHRLFFVPTCSWHKFVQHIITIAKRLQPGRF